MNIRLLVLRQFFHQTPHWRLLPVLLFVLILIWMLVPQKILYAAEVVIEPIQACVIPRDAKLNPALRSKIAQCLGWQEKPGTLCQGGYSALDVQPLEDDDEIRLWADEVSFYREGQSTLTGHVEAHQTGRIVSAQTATVYRDAKTDQVTEIELLGGVRLIEPGRLMIARKAKVNPQDKSGQVEDVLYRFNTGNPANILPAWGRASLIQRFANKNYLLNKATYSTCAPQDRAWQIEADSITLDQATSTGVARHAKVLIHDVPVLYTPYLSFPTTKERKSGFLIPSIGSSNIGGFNLALPYYWNIAPNYDATIIPEIYTRRGFMMGGQFRYLTEKSTGMFNGSFLPDDQAYKKFLNNNQTQFPQLQGDSADRWAVQLNDITQINPNLKLRVNFQQVSDDYYLQDFSTNLAVLTERQLLRQGDLTYTTDNWLFRGAVQSYQTLQPVNQTPVSVIYERLPQLMAAGSYTDLPFNANLSLLGQFDYFNWPSSLNPNPEGPRYYFNPVLTLPYIKPWGFFTPGIELVQSHYDLHGTTLMPQSQFDRSIPRYHIDSGLYFDKDVSLLNQSFTQTLEPRVYYLNVPFSDQTAIPVFDSAYMIFNVDQLFRTNRFSGYDRIGDGNQLAYALTSRFISDETGLEKISLSVGQIRYFQNRRVLLCQSQPGNCVENPSTLGFLSPLSKSSPIASRAVYHFNRAWSLLGDYVWDPYTSATNNGHVDFQYQPAGNHLVSLGYTYLVNGDITQVAQSPVQNNALHQASFSYAWPFNDRWSSLGAYSYNLSKGYEMMAFLGVQYDSCCWAMRLLGGRTFQSLSNQLTPQYNNNVYLQFLLKGLGSVGNSNPTSIIHSYLPGYVDSFHR